MIDMDYKQKYKEALTWVESIYHELSHDRQMEAEAFFPELKESEDEKIRKEILSFCQGRADNYPNAPMYGNIRKWIAWLEKQGEQKSYGQREECLDCQFNYAGECKGSCAMKRSERKPADKVEPLDEFAGLTDFERTLADVCIGWIGKEIGWKQYIKDNADALLQIAVEKFNSVQDAPFEQKDAFIKKAATWFANRYQVNGYLDADDIEDFKKYMEE